MKKLFIAFYLFSSTLCAAPYQSHSPEDIINFFTYDKTGKTESISADVVKIETFIKELEIHAFDYPPQFDNETEKKQAAEEVLALSNMMSIFAEETKTNLNILRLVLRLNVIAYNLDVQPELSKTRVTDTAQHIFVLQPNDTETNYRLGYFLSQTNDSKPAVDYLTKAVQAEYLPAYKALVIAYLMAQQPDKALEVLSQYQKKAPDDPMIETLTEAINSGQFTVVAQ